ncbi:NADH-quinone oxidoreductase subunit M [Flavobacterium akiainvivens]|uniref:NADH-quinone oxidoreductase subunit M n=1 Tax=Flavobacterium akiainvivens TaxID=1202724 RepID=A0A0M8MJZ4_9FLAO|nr:NADH-quinone oxidoreductase subunit M [Flavobacterium akiainvivens]KOS07377.1 NADH-quinone oxidoreductase subunit M [Flavobacterium akiainvivens]SFQ47388.1 NADH dehydrogenase subunit M [Flavobacterium akiainvivens]
MNVSLILVILLFGALATWYSGDKWASKVALAFSTVAFGVTAFLTYRFFTVDNPTVTLSFSKMWIANPRVVLFFKADGLSLAMALLTTALTPIIILTSFANLFPRKASFYGLILFMAFAMAGTFLSEDGFLYYIFWELSLIPIYFIALMWGGGDAEERKKAVVKFFIYTFAGSLFMLLAFIYIYQRTGSFLAFNLYNARLNETEEMLIFLAFFLAYAIKIPIIPFHTWQANVYQKAPAAGTMLLSGIMLKMALFSIIKWQLPIAPHFAEKYKYIFIALCVAGVIYGSILALKQTNLKKLLAYSSLAHVGLVAAGAYTMTLDGFRGAVLQMLAHGFVVVGLFFAAEIIERRFATQEIADMGGIRLKTPVFSSMFMILVLASVALPSTFNFVGEFELLYSLAQANIWMAVVGGLTIILGAFYMLRMFQQVMLGDGTRAFADVTVIEGVAFVLIIAVLLFFGVYPKPLVELVTPTLNELLTYIKQLR